MCGVVWCSFSVYAVRHQTKESGPSRMQIDKANLVQTNVIVSWILIKRGGVQLVNVDIAK